MKTETSDILTTASAEHLDDAMILQINKDLARAGVDGAFDVDIVPESLARSLRAMRYDLIVSGFERYLLYCTRSISQKRISRRYRPLM